MRHAKLYDLPEVKGSGGDPEGEPDVREPLRLLLRDLRTGLGGLSTREAQRRLAAHGANELAEVAGRRLWADVLAQLVHPLALLLWLASALSFAIGTPLLAVAIIAVVVLNAAFALWQEHQTEQAIELLRTYLPPTSLVLRDGQVSSVPAAELVPGDIVVLGEGDRVSADGRLVDGALEIDMSTLTGESEPLERVAGAEDVGVDLLSASDLVFSGTTVLAGQARAVVSSTGMTTELGRIAALSHRVSRERSPLERQVRRVAWLIALVAVVVGLAFIPLGTLLAGLPLQSAIVFAVGLLVANVPEGLLPTITLALAVGVRALAARGALVKRLSAVETLGSTAVICTDKTGTLTENRMSPVKVWTHVGIVDVSEEVGGASGSNEVALEVARSLVKGGPQNSGGGVGGAVDPTDVALAAAAACLGADASPQFELARRYRFDPNRRVMSVVERVPGGAVVHVKGAPESVLSRCTRVRISQGESVALDDATSAAILDEVSALASQGLRVVGVAIGSAELPEGARTVDDVESDRDRLESGLELLGLVALVDPIRSGVHEAVARCHDAGIRVMVVTGDHALTAAAIARQAGIGSEPPFTVTASGLSDMSEDDLDDVLAREREVVFARSSPETKLRVTDALRAGGAVVAMTGDGVNDAPALQRADIGIAMGRSGTDVAREAATLVLTDDDFSTIVAAVEEGRRVYDNVRKFIVYIFAHATPEMVPFVVYALSGGRIPLPLTVIAILAIDIGTETLPALALGREPAEPGLMERPPRPRTESIITGGMLVRSWLLLGGVSAALVLAGYFWVLLSAGWTVGAPTGEGTPLQHVATQASTMTFLGIVACQIGTAFAARTEHASLWSIGLFTNRLLLWGIAMEVVLAALVVGLPGVSEFLGMAVPPVQQLLVLPLFPVVVWGVDEVVRWVRRRHSRVGAGHRSGSRD